MRALAQREFLLNEELSPSATARGHRSGADRERRVRHACADGPMGGREGRVSR